MSDTTERNKKDLTTTVQCLKDQVDAFVAEREWHQFHLPKNLCISLAVEAAELMEIFMWTDSGSSRVEAERKRERVEEELADVILSAICFANSCNIDISSVLERKLATTAKKYPVEKVRGKSDKYTEYKD